MKGKPTGKPRRIDMPGKIWAVRGSHWFPALFPLNLLRSWLCRDRSSLQEPTPRLFRAGPGDGWNSQTSAANGGELSIIES